MIPALSGFSVVLVSDDLATLTQRHDQRPMKCSILMPVYNAGPSLQAAIESILSQDEPDFEFLIIDDGSSDASPEIIRDYAARDSRIRAIFHQDNRGVARTLNQALREARADLAVRMDADDESLPGRLRTQIEFLESHPGVAVAGSFVYHMAKRRAHDHLITLPSDHAAIVQTLLERTNCIYHPSVIYRRGSMLALGGYRDELEPAEDYDLWLRASRVHQLANIPVPLLRYRFTLNGTTFRNKWEGLHWVQMALISHTEPGSVLSDVCKAAGEALSRLDRRQFAENVAIGTVEELVRLRWWKDASRFLARSWKHLAPSQRWRLMRHATYFAVTQLAGRR
jgi:hypothetical protein